MQTVDKATEKQVQYLHFLYRKLNWDEEMYRSMLQHNYGVDSTKDLTKLQAVAWINKLTSLVEQLNDHITPKQMHLIRELWMVIDYAKGAEGDVYLNKFINKYYRKGILADLTKREAISLIKQIGQMTKQAEERRGKTTVLKRRTRCANCGKLIMWVQLKDERREAFDCAPSASTASRSANGANSGTIEYVATDFHKCYER